MEHVRPKDALVVQQNGMDWLNPLSGGPSTFDHKFLRSNHWWMIPQGRDFSALLTVRNDHGRHWVWEPAQGMELAQFIALLTDLNQEFVPA